MAQQVFSELGAAVQHNVLAEWALDIFFRWRCKSVGSLDSASGNPPGTSPQAALGGPRDLRAELRGRRHGSETGPADAQELSAVSYCAGSAGGAQAALLDRSLPPSQLAPLALQAVLHLLWGL